VNSLFPGKENGRIPIVGITGTHGKTLIARLVARLLHLSGKHVGLACDEGLYLNQRCLEKGNCANWAAAHKVLLNRAVEAAVFVNAAREILAEGLAYDRCHIGVVTNLSHTANLDEFYVHEPEQVYNVLRTQVDIVLPDGVAVLNADDPMVARMAELCDGEVLFFAVHSESPVIVEHLAQGGRAVILRNEHVLLAKGQEIITLSALEAIPLLNDNNSQAQVESLLAAVGTAWALNVSVELIRAGIEAFTWTRQN
jgi:cyanophycin synthetase